MCVYVVLSAVVTAEVSGMVVVTVLMLSYANSHEESVAVLIAEVSGVTVLTVLMLSYANVGSDASISRMRTGSPVQTNWANKAKALCIRIRYVNDKRILLRVVVFCIKIAGTAPAQLYISLGSLPCI